jgi:hypothetical protein
VEFGNGVDEVHGRAGAARGGPAQKQCSAAGYERSLTAAT